MRRDEAEREGWWLGAVVVLGASSVYSDMLAGTHKPKKDEKLVNRAQKAAAESPDAASSGGPPPPAERVLGAFAAGQPGSKAALPESCSPPASRAAAMLIPF